MAQNLWSSEKKNYYKWKSLLWSLWSIYNSMGWRYMYNTKIHAKKLIGLVMSYQKIPILFVYGTYFYKLKNIQWPGHYNLYDDSKWTFSSRILCTMYIGMRCWTLDKSVHVKWNIIVLSTLCVQTNVLKIKTQK